MGLNKIILRKNKKEALSRKHPWIFSGAIFSDTSSLLDGELVYVTDEQDIILAYGHFHKTSIAVRVLNFGNEKYNPEIWKDKFQAAWNYRRITRQLIDQKNNAFRWIHGEGDGLSGLIVDVYNDLVVIQCHTIGMYKNLEDITNAILSFNELRIHSIYCKSKETLPKVFADTINNHFIKGNKLETTIVENGLNFKVNVIEGQKTGFFLDQKINRNILLDYVDQKTVLNTFSYSGAFSCYALLGNAHRVDSVDISAKAIDLAKENFNLNHFNSEKYQLFTADVIEFLKDIPQDFYDVIILDPPAFAKSIDKRHNALQAYKRINVKAIQKIKSGGVLFTFSCSQVVTEELFYNMAVAAGIESGRNVRVVQKLNQSPDHPISIFHPEGHYLKGLILYID